VRVRTPIWSQRFSVISLSLHHPYRWLFFNDSCCVYMQRVSQHIKRKETSNHDKSQPNSCSLEGSAVPVRFVSSIRSTLLCRAFQSTSHVQVASSRSYCTPVAYFRRWSVFKPNTKKSYGDTCLKTPAVPTTSTHPPSLLYIFGYVRPAAPHTAPKHTCACEIV
jgi:hypothetical protein